MMGEAVIWEVFPEVVLEDQCNLGRGFGQRVPAGKQRERTDT